MSLSGLRKLENHTVNKIKSRIVEIGERVWLPKSAVADVAVAETMEHLSLSKAKQLTYKPMKGPLSWGREWSTAWFRIRAVVPKSYRGEKVALLFDPQGECIIFRDGLPVQGLDRNRNAYVLFEKAKGGERVELYVEAGASNIMGAFQKRLASMPELAVMNEDVWDAHHDLAALSGMIDFRVQEGGWDGGSGPFRALEIDDPWRAKIIYTLNKTVDIFDYLTDDPAIMRRKARGISAALKPLYAHQATASAMTVACMGHAHIDVAWLWPLAETVRKCGRTFSNTLALMDRYPEYMFCQSQPHLYEFTRDRYPSLYKRIKQKVKKGQWIPTGCTWVEMDCNVTSGESLVRQILFGMRFFKKEFNYKPACLWIPDVFGYSAAIPQILKLSGIDNFLTQKISWSQYTKFPHHSFNWEGIDGSSVLSHFLPADTYNAQNTATELISGARKCLQKDRTDIYATLFGHGDGGGGPTDQHIERMKRYKNIEGMPKCQPMNPTDFFARLKNNSRDLPQWVGELYLEYHRGTYTTQGWTKRNNRKAELLLRETELLSALSMVAGSKYEQEQLNAAWKLVLLNQFHDIIPGSSKDMVYEDADRDYAEVFKTTNAVREKALTVLSKRVDTRGAGIPVIVNNSLSWDHSECVEVAGLKGISAGHHIATDAKGNATPVQVGKDGCARFIAEAPSMGHSVYHISKGKCDAPVLKGSEQLLENEYLRARFDAKGNLVSLVDKANGREAIENGAAANDLLLFEDKTVGCGSAWDIDIHYNDKMLEKGQLVSARIVEHGPVRTVLRIVRTISRSKVIQDVTLAAGAKRLDFVTTIEWGDEKYVLLKVAFPVAVRSDKARYEIQYGSVERPNHWNTPQDFAKFEVAAQKWADLSEAGYGVALLNDCKYGHDTRGNVMRLTLLRASKAPGKTADVNKTHKVTFSLYPHAGDFTNGVVQQGYELNVPLQAAQVKASAGPVAPLHSFFGITGDNVVIDCVKKAEDTKQVIVRMYEAHGSRGKRTFCTSLNVSKVEEVNLMEAPVRELAVRKGKVSLSFTPYQIRTLRLTLRG